jgi:capsular polysaccharide biosynthesis protein
VEIDEVVARLTRRYWFVLLVALLLPMAVVGYLVSQTPKQYTAHARVTVSDQVPKSAAEASALTSQVQALATSRDVVAQAMNAGQVVGRDAQNVADHHVAVSGNGTSAIVDVSVIDKDAGVAQRLTNSLASGVTAAFDQSRIGNLPSVLASVDKQLLELSSRRAPIAAQLSKITAIDPHDGRLPTLQSELAGIDILISDLSADRNRLSEQLAAAGHATVVATADRPAHPDSSGLVQKVALAGILGLIVGLIITAFLETVRPTVSGAARLGRLLAVPLLGRLEASPTVLQALGRRIRLAARRAAVIEIVVTNASGQPVPQWAVDRLESVVLHPLEGYGAVREDAPLEPAAAGAGRRTPPSFGAATNPLTSKASRNGNPGALAIRAVSALDELSPTSETDAVGVILLASGTTNASALHEIRDLLNASGWPLLGVVASSKFGGRT